MSAAIIIVDIYQGSAAQAAALCNDVTTMIDFSPPCRINAPKLEPVRLDQIPI